LPNTTGGSSLGPSSGTVWGGLWSTGSLVGSYDLRLITTDNAGNTVEQIRSVTFSGSAPRGPPAALLATAIAGGVRLTWPAAGSLTQVRRSATGATGPFELIAQTLAASYDDLSASPNTTYWYVLLGADGADSTVATATALSDGRRTGAGHARRRWHGDDPGRLRQRQLRARHGREREQRASLAPRPRVRAQEDHRCRAHPARHGTHRQRARRRGTTTAPGMRPES